MNIINFIDAPDPDNFVQLLAARRAFPDARQYCALTGRPVSLDADKDTPKWLWNEKESRLAQAVSAQRILNFTEEYGFGLYPYDGGVAPRTLVPHHLHFKEYYKFDDVDPLMGVANQMLEQEYLVELLGEEDFYAVVGGPMTGLAQCLARNPEIADKCKGVFAMFGTWGDVDLMSLDDKPRGALQFNVACDPFAAHMVLTGLNCPIYMIPSECTRVEEISFEDSEAFADFASPGNKGLVNLYHKWYEAACKPRGERIYIHDVCSAFALYDDLMFDPVMSPESTYKFEPVHVEVPHLPRDRKKWGTMTIQKTATSNVFCATEVDTERYMYLLKTTLTAKS